MGFWKIFGFGVVFLFSTSSLTNAEPCVAKTPCSCEFSNGTGIDLSPAISSGFYTADIYAVKMNGTQYEMSTYYYHPCYDMSMNVSQPTLKNTCTLPLSICRHVSTMNLLNKTASTYTFDEGSYDFMGRSNISQFSDQGNSIIYPNGPSETIVLLECAETENNLQVYSLAEPDKIVLAFYSRDACLKQIEVAGRSFGSTLLIIFFSFVVFYLVLGICTKKFLMGATGVEIIPNLAFWSELPNLVKMTRQQLKNSGKLMKKSCMPKNDVTEEEVGDIEKGKFIESRNVMCYIACIYTMTQAVKNNKLSYEAVIKQVDIMFPAEMREAVKAAAASCKDTTKKYKDLCEASYWTAKCMYDYDAENFVFP